MDFVEQIKENNKTHVVDEQELNELISKAKQVYQQHFDNTVWFERSIFINWTCAIADCKYCYLSTRPKHKAGTEPTALRSPESIVAEVLLCKAMGWKVGYITGGLRVESTEYLIELIKKINQALGEKVMMNFGPYVEKEVLQLKPFINGMGCAIESFDEELHSFICPSKPLKSLLRMLETLDKQGLTKIITIILGMGERKDDVYQVIENIKKYKIDILQLCFLKPQADTVFAQVPPPDPKYMAWWIATVRIACPKLNIKVALVKECVDDFDLLLQAGANCFSRFMVFKEFNTGISQSIMDGTRRADRKLLGHFDTVPHLDVPSMVNSLEPGFKERVQEKLVQYKEKLEKSMINVQMQ